jgi:hypothetical protein
MAPRQIFPHVVHDKGLRFSLWGGAVFVGTEFDPVTGVEGPSTLAVLPGCTAWRIRMCSTVGTVSSRYDPEYHSSLALSTVHSAFFRDVVLQSPTRGPSRDSEDVFPSISRATRTNLSTHQPALGGAFIVRKSTRTAANAIPAPIAECRLTTRIRCRIMNRPVNLGSSPTSAARQWRLDLDDQR